MYGIIDYSTNIQGIIRDGMTYVENVRQLERLRRLSVLLVSPRELDQGGPTHKCHVPLTWPPGQHGPKGSGKTALATHIALQSGFSFIKASTYPEIGASSTDKVLTRVSQSLPRASSASYTREARRITSTRCLRMPTSRHCRS